MSWKECRLRKRENSVLRQTDCTNWITERKIGKWLLKLSAPEPGVQCLSHCRLLGFTWTESDQTVRHVLQLGRLNRRLHRRTSWVQTRYPSETPSKISNSIKKKRLAALSMLHKAKKAYYACDVIRFLVPYAARSRLAARTGCAVHAPCLLAVRQLP